MKIVYRFICLIAFLSLLSFGCASQEKTCEEDQINENWDKVVKNGDCTDEEKAEAYLALAGFNYFDFIGTDDPNLTTILNLSAGNWAQKQTYVDKAARLVRSMRTGTQKTIYLFSSFLGLYIYLSANLDNGIEDASGDASSAPQAFDGEFAQSEINGYTGSGISTDSSGDDGTTLTSTQYFQIRFDGDDFYYIYDSSDDSYYYDTSGDGIPNNATSDAVVLAKVAMYDIVELNQVFQLDDLVNPLSSGENVDADELDNFGNQVLDYLVNIDNALTRLDATGDEIREITDFRLNLDNGGECDLLNTNPTIKLVQYFATAFQFSAIDDYTSKNLLTSAELTENGETDTSTDTSGLPGGIDISNVDVGLKVLFLSASGSYIPYWEDATADIVSAMEVVNQFDQNNVERDDNVLSFSEMMCASELMAEE